MRKVILAPVEVAALASLLGACAVGPNFVKPAPPAVSRYTAEALPDRTASSAGPAGAAQRLAPGAEIDARWWTLFGSPELTRLVDDAVASNYDLQAAQAALRAARETYYAQRGTALPTVDAGYNLTRQRISKALAPPLSSNAELFTLHTAQLSVGYTPDVFGGVRRQTEAVKAQAEAQRFQTEAAFLTLTSNVVVAAIQQASLREQIAETLGLIAADQQTLTLLRRQFQAGQIARQDVVAQETAVAQAEQTLPPLEKQLAQQNDLIAALTGRTPSELHEPPIDLGALRLPAELPVSLPSELVEQRPDIRAAQANLHAASAQVGVAMAARLPMFPLTANLGGAASDLGRLFSGGDSFWLLSGQVTQPIFHGGSLRHRQRAAEAGLDQAKAQYSSAVLTAFQNVADSLEALEADAHTLTAASVADRAAKESLAMAQQQFAAGQSTSLAVLQAEQAQRQVRIALTQAQAARFADTSALFQALGGGWWNRGDSDLAHISVTAAPGR